MAASTPAMVLGQVEAELRRRGYKFQEDEDLIFHTDNRLLTGIGERTTDCTVVTTNALVHFENGAMERRLHRTNVIGVWFTNDKGPFYLPKIQVGIRGGQTESISVRNVQACKQIFQHVDIWAKQNYNRLMKSTHKIKDQKDQPVRAKCQGALRGYMLDGALTWSDRDYVFSNVPPSLVGSVHLRLKHHSYKRGAVPVIEVEEPAVLFIIFEAPPTGKGSINADNTSGGLCTSLSHSGWKQLAEPPPRIIGPKYGNKSQVVFFRLVEPGRVVLPQLTTSTTCLAYALHFGDNGKLVEPKALEKKKRSPAKSTVKTDSESAQKRAPSGALVVHSSSQEYKDSGKPRAKSDEGFQIVDGKEEQAQDGELQLSKEEMKNAAAAIGMNRPKHLGDGIVSGLKAAGGGVLVGLGYLCYAPYAGAKEDGIKGFGTGLLKGVAGAVTAPVVGAAMGVTQIVRGAVNTPGAVSAGIDGKVWDSKREEWVTPVPYDLMQHYYKIKEAKGDHQMDNGEQKSARKVKNPKFYQLLGVPTDASQKLIRKAYYKEALKSHPDKNPDDPEAKDRFQQLSKAYQVLSNPRLRDEYDKYGESAAEGIKVDVVSATAIFFSSLFGSEHFEPFVGEFALSSRLAKILNEQMDEVSEVGAKTATNLLTDEDDQEAQDERRVMCAVHTMKVIEPYVCGKKDDFIATMRQVAAQLVTAPFGQKLVKAMGESYTSAASMFLGYQDSFLGVEGSIAAVSKRFHRMNKGLKLARKGFSAFRAAGRIASTADADTAYTLKSSKVEAKLVSIQVSKKGNRVTRLVKLESQQKGFTELRLDGNVEQLSIVKRLSKVEPKLNKNYGSHKDALWCDQGCRALFRVTTLRETPFAPEELSSPEEAAAAAATAKVSEETSRGWEPQTPPGGAPVGENTAQEEPDEKKHQKTNAADGQGNDEEDDGNVIPARARASERELEEALPTFLQAIWALTEMDVSETLQAVCTKLFTDIGVDKETRKSRARAVRIFGRLLLEAERNAKSKGIRDKESKLAAGDFTGKDAKIHIMASLQHALMKSQKQEDNEEKKS